MHQRSAHRSLLVVGSVAFDDIDGPFGMHRDLLGGSASFIARAAAYFTRNVSVVAVIGDDFPATHLDEMAALGDRHLGHRARPRARPSTGSASTPPTSPPARPSTPGSACSPTSSPSSTRPTATPSSSCSATSIPALQLDVLEQVTRAGAGRHRHDEPVDQHQARGPRDACSRRTHTLMLNDEEARLLAGEHNLRKAAAHILKLGPTSVIIKRGDAGALLFHGGGVFAAPAMPLADVKDPTGAGDSFAGGLHGLPRLCGRPVALDDPHRDDHGQRDGQLRGREVLGRRPARPHHRDASSSGSTSSPSSRTSSASACSAPSRSPGTRPRCPSRCPGPRPAGPCPRRTPRSAGRRTDRRTGRRPRPWSRTRGHRCP